MQPRIDVDDDGRMLHCNAGHAIALMSFCTRTTQQLSGLEVWRDGGGAITICDCSAKPSAFTA